MSVTNAGVLSGGVYPELDFDPSPGQVLGIIKIQSYHSSNKTSFIEYQKFWRNSWYICGPGQYHSERKDLGYKSAGAATPGTGFVTSYTNPVSGTYDTWGTPAYTPGSGAPTSGVDLDSIYGVDNYIFE